MMTIENDRQLKTAIDFVNFIKRHNTGVKDDEVERLRTENRELRKQVDELEREVRVGRDLLAIAGRCR